MTINPLMLQTGAATGVMPAGEVDELMKALTAGYGTDVAQLTGGGALRVQSLDTVMQSTIQENKHFRLFNKLAKPKAGATVDEWTEQNSVGGFLGGTTNTETGVIAAATGNYNRRTGLVKYLMTRREVSLVQTLQKAIADSEAIEYSNGALQLLSDAEYLLFEGNSVVVPTEYDGITAQMVAGVAAGQVDGANIIDLQAQPLKSIEPVNQASAQIRRYGNFGTATDIFFNQEVQADFDNNLDPAFRVPLTSVGENGTRIGAPVVGIRTSGGPIECQEDVFIRNDGMLQPFEVQYPAIAPGNIAQKPTVLAGVAGSDAASAFAAGSAGNYYYLAAGVNANGQSAGLVSAQVAVTAGQSVTVTITRSAGAQETGYVIYRSRLNGGNSVAGSVPGQGSDFREMVRVGVAGATTTYVDQNRDIPGTTKAFVLNMSAGATAITWRQLLPMLKFPLYATVSATIPWAQMLFGYLRISKRKHHVIIKNILPTGAVWRPFNV